MYAVDLQNWGHHQHPGERYWRRHFRPSVEKLRIAQLRDGSPYSRIRTCTPIAVLAVIWLWVTHWSMWSNPRQLLEQAITVRYLLLAFLRRASIDELPQLFNVLRGEMSLVGPRPLPLRDVSRFEEAWLLRRFSVRPGLTGLWQVSGRSNTSFDHWIKQDLTYIDHWSIALDLKILLLTIPAVLRGSGAV